MEIPKQLQKQKFRFTLLGEGGTERAKIPIEKNWQVGKHDYKSKVLQSHQGNYGVACGFGGLVVIDFDNEKIQSEIVEKLPKTFTVQTGSGLLHKYFSVDNPKSFKVLDKEKNSLADIQGTGKQVVAPNSIHPNGNPYEIVDNFNIAKISMSQIKALFFPYMEVKQNSHESKNDTLVQDIKSKISVPDILLELGVDTSKNPTNCPFHQSKKNACLSFKRDVWHCFHCEGGGDIFNLVMLKEKCDFKKALEFLSEKIGLSQKPMFEYEIQKPEIEIRTLEDLKQVIIENFPDIWFETKTCLSCYCSLALKNLNGCPSLNLVGNPSGEKTTVLSFFYGHDLSYLSDDFTPKAFVTHSANVGLKNIEDVDLLPKIKNKVLISPELAPLFESSKDKLTDNFAILTRVLDGEGLNRDSGVHGHRGYSGDFKFVWLGATTPLRASVWNIMGKIGNRLLFLNMNEKNRTDKDYVEMFRTKQYEDKIKVCRGAVRSFLNNFFKKYQVRTLDWDNEQDILLLPEIIRYSKFLGRLRATLLLWKSEDKGKYEHNFPIIEEPPRAINSLYNIAKGHALINGRTFLKREDLEPVRKVAFSSMPHDRMEFLKILSKHDGRLTTKNIEQELRCSDETARKTMEVFGILKIVDVKNLDIETDGRPMKFVEIRNEFKGLLQHTQVLNDLENSIPSLTHPVRDPYDNVKFDDLTKND
jgi:hypothetical protein